MYIACWGVVDAHALNRRASRSLKHFRYLILQKGDSGDSDGGDEEGEAGGRHTKRRRRLQQQRVEVVG